MEELVTILVMLAVFCVLFRVFFWAGRCKKCGSFQNWQRADFLGAVPKGEKDLIQYSQCEKCKYEHRPS